MNLNDMRRLAGLPVLAEASDEYDFGIETEEYGQHAGDPPTPDFEMVKVELSTADGEVSPFVKSAPSTSDEEISFEDNSEDSVEFGGDKAESDQPVTKRQQVAVEDSEPDFDNEEDVSDDSDDASEDKTETSDEGSEEQESREEDDELARKVRKGDDLHETYLHTLMVMAQSGDVISEARAMRIAKKRFGDQ